MDEFQQRLALVDSLNRLRNDYHKTLLLLQGLKAGTVDFDRIVLTADGWQILTVEVEEPKLAEEPSAV